MSAPQGQLQKPIKKLLFISHATPEDNDFARWLSIKLAAAGYAVWSDVEQLLGGEKFWLDIKDAIENHAAKVIWCGSTRSVAKPGVLKELEITLNTEQKTGINLIIPLRLDEVRYNSFPHELASHVNIIPFNEGWAPGLATLLQALKRENIPIGTHSNETISAWWAQKFSKNEGVEEASEPHISNIFESIKSPEYIYFYQLGRTPPKNYKYEDKTFPARPYRDGIITCASEDYVRKEFRNFGFFSSQKIPWLKAINDGWQELGISKNEIQKRLYWMIRLGFRKLALSRGFKSYELAQKSDCFWLCENTERGDDYPYINQAGKISRRALVGYNSYGMAQDGVRKRRNWHFAIQPKPIFTKNTSLIIKTHVIFTEDGKTPIDSDAKQHSARRSACKSWWNDAWRDRLLAAFSHLAQNQNIVEISLGENASLHYSTTPLILESSRKYKILEKQAVEQLPQDESELENPFSSGEDIE